MFVSFYIIQFLWNQRLVFCSCLLTLCRGWGSVDLIYDVPSQVETLTLVGWSDPDYLFQFKHA